MNEEIRKFEDSARQILALTAEKRKHIAEKRRKLNLIVSFYFPLLILLCSFNDFPSARYIAVAATVLFSIMYYKDASSADETEQSYSDSEFQLLCCTIRKEALESALSVLNYRREELSIFERIDDHENPS